MKRLPTMRGAAIVMALLVVVLATLAVSSLIWRVFAMGKSVEVLAARNQAREVAQASTDWARLILREDGRVSNSDTLSEPWAVPLADTRLGESLQPQTGGIADDREALVTGRIEDAQGRFNLHNLTLTSRDTEKFRAGFDRMCETLGVGKQQAARVVELVQAATPAVDTSGALSPAQQPLQRWQDLRGAPGLSEQTWRTLQSFVVWLPQSQSTTVNANTAPAEVLYAAMPDLDWASVQMLVGARDRLSFRTPDDIRSQLPGAKAASVDTNLIGVQSDYFLAGGAVQVRQARIISEALLQRDRGANKVYVVWRFES
ncbi:MAG: type II secretion system minor pseudopilin GspK [Burkholderiaceae bacterium]|jgi:general secretion pathway protein K